MKKSILSLLFILLLILCGCQSLLPDESALPSDTLTGNDVLADDTPYSLRFASAGDGTCAVTGIRFNYSYRDNYTLTFPAQSPDGDKVTYLDYGKSMIIPEAALKGSFEQILEEPLKKFYGEQGERSFYYKKIMAYYVLKDISTISNEAAKQELLAQIPFSEHAAVFVLDPSTSPEEKLVLMDLFSQAGITTADFARIHTELYTEIHAVSGEGKDYTIGLPAENAVFYPAQMQEISFPSSLTAMSPDVSFAFASITSFDVPDFMTEIPQEFLECNTKLQSIRIHDNVTIIQDAAFRHCTALREITLPDGLQELHAYAFYGCTSLSKAHLPDGIQILEDEVFAECSQLKSVRLPQRLCSIPNRFFAGCGLESIVLPDTVDTIGEEAFANCTSLQSVVISQNVFLILDRAFYGCTSLQSITVPAKVDKLCEQAFGGCTGMTSITFESPNNWRGGRTSDGNAALDFNDPAHNAALLTDPDNHATYHKTK